MNTIPVTAMNSGLSSGRMIQLSMAPNTGIRNFHTFRTETLMPGRLSRTNHILNAVADMKLSHPREI